MLEFLPCLYTIGASHWSNLSMRSPGVLESIDDFRTRAHVCFWMEI